ncbi:MAG: hypothetical protein WDA02_06665 [Saccharofermentanales bacterium]
MVNQIKYIEWYKLYHDYDYDDEKYYNFKRYLKIKKVKGELLVKYQ